MSDPIGNFLSITWWRTVFQKFGRAFGWGCAVVFAIPLVMVGVNQFSGRNTQAPGAAARDTQLMTVNGEAVSMGDYYAVAQRAQMGTPGEVFARTTGEIIDSLVKQVVLSQAAKKAGVKAGDAEVDKTIQDIKVQRVGKNATDADMENYIYQSQHLSMSEFRELVAKSFLGKALLDDEKKKMVVTVEEARNQSAEVRLTVVLIPTTPATPMSGMPPNPKAVPDALAKTKAEALLADAKSGKADIAAIAKTNSADFFAKQAGDTGYRPEYQSAGMPAGMGILGYGKDVDDAVHKAKVGDYIGVLKATGFQSGYFFAKLVDRRNNLPKDFAEQKVVDQLKEQRANELLIKQRDDLAKAAKIEFPADRLEQKAYYDFFVASKMEQERSPMFGTPTGTATEEQVNKLKALANSEIEALYKKDPTNTTAAVLVLNSVKAKIGDPKTPPVEQAQLRERLLPLYQSVIKATEGDNYVYRFGLGDALRDKKQFAEAYKNYHAIGTSLDLDTPTELKSMQDAKQVRQQLAMALKTVASPEAPNAAAEAAAQESKVQELDGQIAQKQLQAAEERKLQEEQRKMQADLLKKQAKSPKSATPSKPGADSGVNLPAGFGKSLDLGSGSGKDAPAPPTPVQPNSAPAPTPSGTSVPSSKPTAPPPAGGPGR